MKIVERGCPKCGGDFIGYMSDYCLDCAGGQYDLRLILVAVAVFTILYLKLNS